MKRTQSILDHDNSSQMQVYIRTMEHVRSHVGLTRLTVMLAN